jgi:hypothetical protein
MSPPAAKLIVLFDPRPGAFRHPVLIVEPWDRGYDALPEVTVKDFPPAEPAPLAPRS